MLIKPLLSYKQLRQINIDTSKPEMKLGEDMFTIAFRLSPYPSMDKNNDDFNNDAINMEELYTEDSKRTDWHSKNTTDLFPIFTYNKTLLYDHFNRDSKTYFYNTHACYIYKDKLHQLINDMSDSPILHLEGSIQTLDRQTQYETISCGFNVMLTRHGNRFSMDIASIVNNRRLYGQRGFPTVHKSVTLNDGIDLDIYDTGNLTLGYAERVPTYAYGSITYKNTLFGNLDYFKIFKDTALQLHTDDINNNANFALSPLQNLENITQNSKYVLNGITYHNRDMNKCKVNWLQDQENGEDYDIKKIGNINIVYNPVYDSDDYEQKEINSNIFDNNNDDYQNQVNTESVYPIIKFDVEKQIDATNVEFYQERFVFKGTYNDTTADFTSMELEIDTLKVENIDAILSIYDIFIGQSSGSILVNDIANSTHGQNYLSFINLINNLIYEYRENGIDVKNIQIIPNNKFQYSFKLNIELNTNYDNVTKPYLPEWTHLKGQYFASDDFNDAQIKFDVQLQLFYYSMSAAYAESAPYHCTISQSGISVHGKNVTKFMPISDDLYFIGTELTSEHILGTYTIFPASSQQYKILFDDVKYITPNDGAIRPALYSSFITPSDLNLLPNASEITIETLDGTALLTFNVFDGLDIYKEITDAFSFDFIMYNTLIIMVKLTDGSKWFFEEVNKTAIKPTLLANNVINYKNEKTTSSDILTSEIANDLSEVVISLDQGRIKNTNSNFIILKYNSGGYTINDPILGMSDAQNNLFYIYNDNDATSKVVDNLVSNSTTFKKSQRIRFINAIDRPLVNFGYAPNPFYGQSNELPYSNSISIDERNIDIIMEYQLLQNPDNTWYVK